MKIEVLPASRDQNGVPQLEMPIGRGKGGRTAHVDLSLSEQQLKQQMSEPVVVEVLIGLWIYRNRFVRVTGFSTVSEELLLRVKHSVLTEERALERLRRDVEAFERFETLASAPRMPIPDDVRMFVWQRDGGRCVKCGSNELLEYDHIIPLVKGGSNSERNIQLLCEPCNRSKGGRIL